MYFLGNHRFVIFLKCVFMDLCPSTDKHIHVFVTFHLNVYSWICGLPLTYIFMCLWSATDMCIHGIVTFHLNVCSWNWDLPLKWAHPTCSNTHKENWLSFSSCYQLPTDHWLGERFHIHFLSVCWDLFRLNLHRAGAFCLYNPCGFLPVVSGDTVFLYPFTTSSCYSHSMLSSPMIPEPWEERV